MQPGLEQLVAALERIETLGSEGIAACRAQLPRIRLASDAELQPLLATLLAQVSAEAGAPSVLVNREKEIESLLSSLFEQFWLRYTGQSHAEPWSPESIEQIAEL